MAILQIRDGRFFLLGGNKLVIEKNDLTGRAYFIRQEIIQRVIRKREEEFIVLKIGFKIRDGLGDGIDSGWIVAQENLRPFYS